MVLLLLLNGITASHLEVSRSSPSFLPCKAPEIWKRRKHSLQWRMAAVAGTAVQCALPPNAAFRNDRFFGREAIVRFRPLARKILRPDLIHRAAPLPQDEFHGRVSLPASLRIDRQ